MNQIKKYRTNEKVISEDTLRKIIQQFSTTDAPTFRKRWNYYRGKQAILDRQMDTGKPNNRIVANFVKSIVDNYEGYAVGKPVKYITDQEDLVEILNYNDINDVDSELYRNMLIYGRGVEIAYIDQYGQTRFTASVTPDEIIPVYDNTLEDNLLYVIRLIQDTYSEDLTPTYTVEVYDNQYRTVYKSDSGFNSFELIGKEAHHYSQVPVCICDANREITGICDSIYSLQDAYNSLISDSINDWDSFCDAYLVLKGAIADSEDLENMKKNRCILLDPDSDAQFLTKATNETEIENLLTTVENKIREMSGCVNFSSSEFGTSSGIAIQFRLLAMNNLTAALLNNFKKSLQKRIELICEILRLKGGDSVWRDIDIEFSINIPTEETANAQIVSQLNGIVSQETLLGLLPFVKDPVEEAAKLNKESEAKMELYQQNMKNNMADDEE